MENGEKRWDAIESNGQLWKAVRSISKQWKAVESSKVLITVTSLSPSSMRISIYPTIKKYKATNRNLNIVWSNRFISILMQVHSPVIMNGRFQLYFIN